MAGAGVAGIGVPAGGGADLVCILEEEEAGRERGGGRVGEFPWVVGGSEISSRRGGGRAVTLLEARLASAPRTPASLFGA